MPNPNELNESTDPELDFELVIEGEEPSTPSGLDLEEQVESSTPTEESSHDDPDDLDDDRLDGGDEPHQDDDREAIRERRRQERQARKDRHRQTVNDLRSQLAIRDRMLEELSTRVSQVETRSSTADLTRIDAGIQQAEQNYNYHKSVLARATTEGDGETAADATEKMLQARVRHNELNLLKRRMTPQPQSQPLDPRMVSAAQEWMDRNKWYNPTGGDQDSQVVLAIDRQLALERLDPTTDSYWDELSRRVEKYLPHRVKRGKIETVEGGSKNPTPPPSRGVSGSKPGRKETYTLSKERVNAMKDAGVWDDPKARADMIRRYREMDRQQRNQGKGK